MKNLVLLFFLGLFLIGCPARTIIIEEPSKGESPPHTDKANWWFLWEDEEGKIFIDINSISYSPEGFIRMWNKHNVTSKFKDIETNRRKEMGAPIKGLKSLSYGLGLLEVDCSNRMVRLLETFNYDDRGKLIDDPVDYMWTRAWRDKWRHIPPGTKIWHLYKYLCQ